MASGIDPLAMAIEILDRGALHAAGLVTLGSPVQVNAQGIRSAQGVGPGEVLLTLVDPIGIGQLLAITPGAQAFQFDVNTVALEAFAGAQSISFMFFQLEQPAVAASGNAPIVPIPTNTNFVKGYALVGANGTILFDTGILSSVNHVAASNLYTLNLQAQWIEPKNGAEVTIAENNPFSAAATVAPGGASIDINTFNAAGTGTETSFWVELLNQT